MASCAFFEAALLVSRYYVRTDVDSFFRVSTVSTSSIFPSINLNLPIMVFRASFGNFLALTVLMRSGISDPFSFFMVTMNFLCCTSLSMAILLANSSKFLINYVLFLVKLSQLTYESYPVNLSMESKF